jgi:predicted DNA-binding transcriptional regulator YafY
VSVSHPATRILAVLELLQNHGQLSGSQLAGRLGVDGRTVRRYIARLEQLGIPIATEQGRHGGYTLVSGFKLPPLVFNDDEALALSLGLLAARGLGLAGAAPGIASAQAKLEQVLPEDVRRRVRAADETVVLDLPRAAAPAHSGALSTLTAAAQQGRRVRLSYRSAPGAGSSRLLDPYGLVYRGGRWYVVGHCHLRRDLRSFRVDRMKQVVATQERFVRPEGFDALQHLVASVAGLPRAFAYEVLLLAPRRIVERELFVCLGTLEETPRGVVLRGQADDLGWVARELARLPFPFEVRAPAALRARLRRRSRELLALARAPGRSAAPGRHRGTRAQS